jgi:hypothetical protein
MNYDEDSGSDKFEKDIDETDDETASVSATDEKSVDLASPLTSTGPRAILTLARSRAEPAPLFVEFDRAAVVTLSSPVAFDRAGFEKTLSDALTSGLLVRGQKLDAQWITKTGKGVAWRALEVPALGWDVQYAIQGNQLVVSNEPEFLSELLATHGRALNTASGQFSDITVLRPAKIREDFESTFDRLAVKDDFFVGNILSLVDSTQGIDTIEKTRTNQGNLMREEVRMTLKADIQIEKATE